MVGVNTKTNKAWPFLLENSQVFEFVKAFPVSWRQIFLFSKAKSVIASSRSRKALESAEKTSRPSNACIPSATSVAVSSSLRLRAKEAGF